MDNKGRVSTPGGPVRGAVRAVLERDGVLDRIGADHIHGNVDQAVAAQIPAEGGTRAGA